MKFSFQHHSQTCCLQFLTLCKIRRGGKVWSGLWCKGWCLPVDPSYVLNKQYNIYVAHHLNTLPLLGQTWQNSSLAIAPLCLLPVHWTSGMWPNLPGLLPPYYKWSKTKHLPTFKYISLVSRLIPWPATEEPWRSLGTTLKYFICAFFFHSWHLLPLPLCVVFTTWWQHNPLTPSLTYVYNVASSVLHWRYQLGRQLDSSLGLIPRLMRDSLGMTLTKLF